MQKRHTDGELYFRELNETCDNFYIPYLTRFINIKNIKVLEVGCGQGGNLKPFYERGCNVVGIDIDKQKIDTALNIFEDTSRQKGLRGYSFIHADFFTAHLAERFDLILVHDVIEHIYDKQLFMSKAKNLLSAGGILFFRFPAGQMPFGGHQQLCKSRVCAALPFIHLLPGAMYIRILRLFGERPSVIDELRSIKDCAVTIEGFEHIAKRCGLIIKNRQLWFINPHYKIKFGLPPVKLPRPFSEVPYLRNFFTTSCFYLLQNK